MIFRESNFEAELEKNRDQPLTPDFLAEQIRLPKDQWDERFSKLIEQKIRENQQVNIEEEEESPETLLEKKYKRYLKSLGLDDEMLKDKKVIDLGTGSGEFVKYLIEKGITKEAYGIDIQLDESLIEEKFKPHLLRGNFEEELLIQNADY
jgi:predicted rRNA methylase YqxC with S4 and FtsJ domains